MKELKTDGVPLKIEIHEDCGVLTRVATFFKKNIILLFPDAYPSIPSAVTRYRYATKHIEYI